MRNVAFVWFLLGLGSELQIVASLSMTEVYILVASVILFPREYFEMRKTGVVGVFWMSVLVIVGGILSVFVHPTVWYFVLRKMATVVLVTCAIVVMHYYLRRCPDGFKWFFVGGAISIILCTFVFRQSVEVTTMGDDAELIMEGPIYWIRRIKAVVMLPMTGWYLKVPLAISIATPIIMAIFSMVTTTSGRSTALGMLGALFFVLLGRKSQRRIQLLGKHFVLISVLSVVFVFVVNEIYKQLAVGGYLGPEAAKKYERQTRGGTDIWHVLMGGRAEAIAPFYITAVEDPFWGLGLCPIDDGSRYERFLEKFGAVEDYEEYVKALRYRMEMGMSLHFMPGHSYMGGFWMTYGISGLIFWIYVCFILIRYIMKDAWVAPFWFGWLACGTPSLLWAIFFSPFAARITVPMMIVACLLARAIRMGKMRLPLNLIMDIQRYAK